MPLEQVTWDSVPLVDRDGSGGHKPAVSLYLHDGTDGGAVALRANTEAVVLPSASSTTSRTSADLSNPTARAALVFLNVTANPGGSESLQFVIQAKDPVSGAYHALVNWNATITAGNGSRVVSIGPGCSTNPVNGQGHAMVLPRTWRVLISHSGAGSWTYSVGVIYGM